MLENDYKEKYGINVFFEYNNEKDEDISVLIEKAFANFIKEEINSK